MRVGRAQWFSAPWPQCGAAAGAAAARDGVCPLLGVLWLDVEDSTALRADRHRDWLHYCVPGPADWWLTFLHHLLAALESSALPG